MIIECDAISVKTRELYLNLIELELTELTKGVEDPHLIKNSILFKE